MTLISASQLGEHELARLGHNMDGQVEPADENVLEAINRSLAVHDEQLGDDDVIEPITCDTLVF